MRSTILLLCLLAAACSTARSEPAKVTTTADATTTAYTKPSTDDLRARLSPLAFEVTQNAATEPPFNNAYWNNHAAGIYVDVVSGEALFSSSDKFESGTGWPSFTRTIAAGVVVEHDDTTFGMVRTEVLSKSAGSHLGHVFDDGPPPTNRRYCMNSAAMRFIPTDRLVAEGYGQYAGKLGMNEAPAATHNACALPPPGTKPHCNATLAVAIFSALPDDGRIAKPKGVLDVSSGHAGAQAAVEVTYNPEQISYNDLVRAWTTGRMAKVFAPDTKFERNEI